MTPLCTFDFPDSLELEDPFTTETKTVNAINPHSIDLVKQTAFDQLIQTSQHDKLGYLLALSSDTAGHVLASDACSFVTSYYVHERDKDPLTRDPIAKVQFYLLHPRKYNQEDKSPQPGDGAGSFTFLFDQTSLESPWILRYIAAHEHVDNTPKNRDMVNNIAKERFAIAQLYEFGPQHPDFKITEQKLDDSTITINDLAAYQFFTKNTKMARRWYKRAADLDNVDALQALARIYFNPPLGLTCSKTKSINYLNKAIDLVKGDEKVRLESKRKAVVDHIKRLKL